MTITADFGTVAAPGDGEAAVRPFRWTRDAYDQLVELGVLGPDDRVQLIEGEIIEMAPQRPPHPVAVGLADDVLREVFGPGFHVRTQGSVALGEHSEPEPDLVVVPGKRRDYVGGHPTGAVLVVEVADTSVRFDRARKGSLYAKFGIREYWIVNLRAHVLEVYRDPVPDQDALYGAAYATRLTFREVDEVTPLGAPGGIVKVADLLP